MLREGTRSYANRPSSGKVVQEPGTVGYLCPGQVQLTVNTNPYEEAWIRVLPGSQAGRLKLKITVRELNAVPNNLGDITKWVELWVLPSDAAGFDTEPLIPPRLENLLLQRQKRMRINTHRLVG